MMNRIFLALIMCCALQAVFLPVPSSNADPNAVVTAAQVNGTWKNRNGTFTVLALGKQRLQVSFSGIYKYNTPAGPSANEGEGSGIAFIEGDTATFKPDDTEDECSITMKFTKNKLIVTQEGFCGFGNHVTAAGTYQKTGSRK